MEKLFALSLGFAGLVLLSQASHGQSLPPGGQCGARAQVLEVLTSKYRETRRGMGLAGQTSVLELFASAETGSWTVTVTLPDGRTCLLASGEGWEPTVEELPAKGKPV